MSSDGGISDGSGCGNSVGCGGIFCSGGSNGSGGGGSHSFKTGFFLQQCSWLVIAVSVEEEAICYFSKILSCRNVFLCNICMLAVFTPTLDCLRSMLGAHVCGATHIHVVPRAYMWCHSFTCGATHIHVLSLTCMWCHSYTCVVTHMHDVSITYMWCHSHM